MEKIISVVIPVYNVDKYLEECLESVINQTYKNLQIILVDDGSTDSSGKICNEYAAKDNRVTVIHQKNQGAGAAKNTGLDLVTGEYVSLIDSDDSIEPEFYEKMLSAMDKYNSDVVQCLFSNVFVRNEYKRNYNFPSKVSRVLNTKKFLFEMLYDWKYSVFCNKLFKTSLLKNTRFPVGRKIDDEFFTYKLICNAKKIVNINDCLYNYRMRKSSVMNDSAQENLLKDRIDCFVERTLYIDNHFPKLDKYYTRHLFYYINTISTDNFSNTFIKYINGIKSQYNIREDNIFDKIIMKIRMRNYESNINVFFSEKEEYFL